jgi:hypothetical protein
MLGGNHYLKLTLLSSMHSPSLSIALQLAYLSNLNHLPGSRWHFSLSSGIYGQMVSARKVLS